MKLTTGISLSIMMLLEYFVWGAWYVTMGTYMSEHLGSTGIHIGAAYSALAIATMSASSTGSGIAVPCHAGS